MRIASYAALSCALLCACSPGIRQGTVTSQDTREDKRVEFALSTPNHISDWQQVQNKLRAEGIECSENASSLGGLSCSIPERSFQHAKEIIAKLVSSNSLTVRIRKQNDSEIFEVYEKGKKVTEQSYIVK